MNTDVLVSIFGIVFVFAIPLLAIWTEYRRDRALNSRSHQYLCVQPGQIGRHTGACLSVCWHCPDSGLLCYEREEG